MRTPEPTRQSRGSLLKPHLYLLGHKLPAYRSFVCLGIVAGFATAITLARLNGISVVPIVTAAGSGFIVVLALAFMTKAAIGNETYSFYHYQMAVMVAAAAALWLTGEPVVRNLDVLILSLGVTHAFGRIGCLAGGCCYGTPSRYGICYSKEHAANDFPAGLVGVRLFPVQLVESIMIVLITSIGIATIARGAPAGSALAWYVVLYGGGRFWLEIRRLDTGHWVGRLTEAQVTAIFLVVAIVVAEIVGGLPMEPTHAVVALLLVVIASARLIRTSEQRLVEARHVLEIADALRRARSRAGENSDAAAQTARENIRIERTSLGLMISAGRIATDRGSVLHYSISSEDSRLSERSARILARLFGLLNEGPAETKLLSGTDAFHVLILPALKGFAANR